MLFITSENEFIFNNYYTTIYFYTPWAYDRDTVNQINLLSSLYKNFYFYAIDVSLFKSFQKRFNIKKFPCVLVLDRNGKIILENEKISEKEALMLYSNYMEM